MRVGVENGTVGGSIFTGSATDAVVFGSHTNSPVQIFQNDTLRIQVPTAQGSSGQFLKTNGAGVTSWDTPSAGTPSYPLTVAGTVTSGGIPYFSSTTNQASSALLAQYGVVVGGGAGNAPATSSGLTFGGAAAGTGLAIAAGTATTDVSAFSLTRTNNNAAVVKGVEIAFTDTTSAAGFLPLNILGGASASTTLAKLSKAGFLTLGSNIEIPAVLDGTKGYGFVGDSGTSWGWRSSGVLSAYVGSSEIMRLQSGTSFFTSNVDPLSATGQYSLGGTFAWASINVGAGANGQVLGILKLTELTTIAAAATTDTTIQMPAGAVVLGVSVRVTVVIPTAATFTVGDSGSAARFSTAAVSVAAGSTDAGTKAGAYYNASALSVRITPDVQPAANSGRVRVTINYYLITPPTS